MEINVISSGSDGNAYILQEKKHAVLIDPGIPIKEIRKKTDINLASLDLCLLSHEHEDHSKAINDISRLAVKCAGSPGTLSNFEKLNGTKTVLKNKEEKNINGWDVLPFDTVHDSIEPFGFLLKSPMGKKVLYATDTAYMKYRFQGVQHYIIECNYQEKYIEENTYISEKIKNRIRWTHQELNTLKDFFKVQDLSKTESIHLIHLSDYNADPKECRKEIEKVTGKKVYVH